MALTIEDVQKFHADAEEYSRAGAEAMKDMNEEERNQFIRDWDAWNEAVASD